MTPKVDFQIHDILIRTLKSPFQTSDEFKNLANNFIEKFQKDETKILELIEKLSGFSYKKDRIPVYLIPLSRVGPPKSYARSELEDKLPGVVLKVFDDHNDTLHIFIHELTHINQWHNYQLLKESSYFVNEDGTKNEFGMELCADIVTVFIIREIFGDDSEIEKRFWNFLQNTNDRNKQKFEELNKVLNSWDLNKKPLKEYIF